MSATRRPALTVDDPLGGPDTLPVAIPAGSGGSKAETTSGLREIPLDAIRPNPHQPRQHFDEGPLYALADSIRERGVLQPILVRTYGQGEYELVAGERRWRAARLAGASTIPAVIHTLGDSEAFEVALIENIAREDLTPIEEARAIVVLLQELAVTMGELATRLGRSRTDLAHTVRLLDLPDPVIALIDTGTLTKGHGKVLLSEPDHHRRVVLARQAVEEEWSVRRLETEIARRDRSSRPPQPHPDATAAAARLEELLTRLTACDASVRPHRRGYQLLLDQHAADRLVELLDPGHDAL